MVVVIQSEERRTGVQTSPVFYVVATHPSPIDCAVLPQPSLTITHVPDLIHLDYGLQRMVLVL